MFASLFWILQKHRTWLILYCFLLLLDTPSHPNHRRTGILTQYSSPLVCHVTHVIWHMSHVRWHVWGVFFLFFFLQIGEGCLVEVLLSMGPTLSSFYMDIATTRLNPHRGRFRKSFIYVLDYILDVVQHTSTPWGPHGFPTTSLNSV